MHEKLYVCGQIIIPVYFPVYGKTKEEAIAQVSETINSRTVSVIDGEIHTWNGKSYPVIANRSRIIWTDAASEEDIV